MKSRAGNLWAWRHIPLAEKCEECEAPAVDRHHKDGDPSNNDLTNVASLCRRCHMLADGRLEILRQHRPARLTHCQRGHELTEENVKQQGNGRACRECTRIRDRERSRARNTDPEYRAWATAYARRRRAS